jgi:hypothetical protein
MCSQSAIRQACKLLQEAAELEERAELTGPMTHQSQHRRAIRVAPSQPRPRRHHRQYPLRVNRILASVTVLHESDN